MLQALLPSFYDELTKLSSVLMHVAGPSGAGKTTLIKALAAAHPNLVTRDMDDFDDEATAQLFPGIRKRQYTHEMIGQLADRRQELMDSFLKTHEKSPVVLAGHHREGRTTLKIPTDTRLMLDTGALTSAWRAYRRSQKEQPDHRRLLRELPEDYLDARRERATLRREGYTPAKLKDIRAQVAGMLKTSALSPSQAKEMVGVHHETKDWPLFEKNLRTKSFRQAVVLHPESDAKLKRYTKTLGEYKTSKDVIGVVPSRTSNKLHKIKELPGGRLGCDCKDWQYSHSHRKTDCAHIQELRGGLS